MDNDRRPIIIEGAMESEIALICDALEAPKRDCILNYPLICGSIDGYPVIVARTRVGLVNAAILTTALCLSFSPLCVISQGTAGGHVPQLHTGDIVLGERLRCMNGFAMSEEDARELEDISVGEWHELRGFESDPRLLDIARTTEYPHGRITLGLIGSADFWTHGEENIRALHDKYGTACEEMESFAAAWACDRTRVPYLAVRILSNNELTGESFDIRTGEYCQRYIVELTRNIIRNYHGE